MDTLRYRIRAHFLALALIPAFFLISNSTHAAAPTAAIAASPVTGNAPLGVFFDASQSSADSATFLWNFGDGAISTAKAPVHTYTVAGTYTAQLTVTNAGGATSASSVTITVTGSGAGVVTSNMNFRWAPISGRILYTGKGHDRITLNSAFNTVDLPARLQGLAASLTINDTFTVNGTLNETNTFIQPPRSSLKYQIQFQPKSQSLQVFIGGADLSLALTGKLGGTLPSGTYPIKFALTIGAESYSVTESFTFSGGTGLYNLSHGIGQINDGFFAVAEAAALENLTGDGHFYQFNAYLSEPAMAKLIRPTSGVFVFTFNEANPLVIPFDRFRNGKDGISFTQPDRDLSGINTLLIDPVHRLLRIRTWDIPASVLKGGTGLPLHGEPFTAFNFTVRLDLDQPDGSTFHAVTATRLSRRTKDDAFWETGRRNRVQ